MTVQEATVEALVSAETRVHNLNLYLDYVRQVDKTLWNAMMDEFDGMAGYTQAADGWQRENDNNPEG